MFFTHGNLPVLMNVISRLSVADIMNLRLIGSMNEKLAAELTLLSNTDEESINAQIGLLEQWISKSNANVTMNWNHHPKAFSMYLTASIKSRASNSHHQLLGLIGLGLINNKSLSVDNELCDQLTDGLFRTTRNPQGMGPAVQPMIQGGHPQHLLLDLYEQMAWQNLVAVTSLMNPTQLSRLINNTNKKLGSFNLSERYTALKILGKIAHLMLPETLHSFILPVRLCINDGCTNISRMALKTFAQFTMSTDLPYIESIVTALIEALTYYPEDVLQPTILKAIVKIVHRMKPQQFDTATNRIINMLSVPRFSEDIRVAVLGTLEQLAIHMNVTQRGNVIAAIIRLMDQYVSRPFSYNPQMFHSELQTLEKFVPYMNETQLISATNAIIQVLMNNKNDDFGSDFANHKAALNTLTKFTTHMEQDQIESVIDKVIKSPIPSDRRQERKALCFIRAFISNMNTQQRKCSIDIAIGILPQYSENKKIALQILMKLAHNLDENQRTVAITAATYALNHQMERGASPPVALAFLAELAYTLAPESLKNIFDRTLHLLALKKVDQYQKDTLRTIAAALINKTKKSEHFRFINKALKLPDSVSEYKLPILVTFAPYMTPEQFATFITQTITLQNGAQLNHPDYQAQYQAALKTLAELAGRMDERQFDAATKAIVAQLKLYHRLETYQIARHTLAEFAKCRHAARFEAFILETIEILRTPQVTEKQIIALKDLEQLISYMNNEQYADTLNATISLLNHNNEVILQPALNILTEIVNKIQPEQIDKTTTAIISVLNKKNLNVITTQTALEILLKLIKKMNKDQLRAAPISVIIEILYINQLEDILLPSLQILSELVDEMQDNQLELFNTWLCNHLNDNNIQIRQQVFNIASRLAASGLYQNSIVETPADNCVEWTFLNNLVNIYAQTNTTESKKRPSTTSQEEYIDSTETSLPSKRICN